MASQCTIHPFASSPAAHRVICCRPNRVILCVALLVRVSLMSLAWFYNAATTGAVLASLALSPTRPGALRVFSSLQMRRGTFLAESLHLSLSNCFFPVGYDKMDLPIFCCEGFLLQVCTESFARVVCNLKCGWVKE